MFYVSVGSITHFVLWLFLKVLHHKKIMCKILDQCSWIIAKTQLFIWLYVQCSDYGENSQMQFILRTYFQWCVPQMRLFRHMHRFAGNFHYYYYYYYYYTVFLENFYFMGFLRLLTTWYCIPLSDSVSTFLLPHGGPDSITVLSLWVVWLAKWQWDRFWLIDWFAFGFGASQPRCT